MNEYFGRSMHSQAKLLHQYVAQQYYNELLVSSFWLIFNTFNFLLSVFYFHSVLSSR